MTGVLNRQHDWKKQVFKDENTLCLAIGLWSNYFLDWCNCYHFAPGRKTSFDKSADIWSKENNIVFLSFCYKTSVFDTCIYFRKLQSFALGIKHLFSLTYSHLEHNILRSCWWS